MGQAAMMQAQTGQDYLAYMQQQAGITNQWAADDRARYESVTVPMQDQYIKDAANYDSADNLALKANQASAQAQTSIDAQTGAMNRQMQGMGVNPNSGKAMAADKSASIMGGLQVAGAANASRAQTHATADAMQANAINMVSGLPMQATSDIQTSNQAASSGYSGAQAGYTGQANSLNQQYSQQMQGYQAKADASSALYSGVGSIVGLAFGSDKNTKKDIKKPGRSLLDAVDSMPVKDWTYKDGAGDGGRHVGTMAQDFKAQTGFGDGRTINVIDAIGTVMGAVQELSKEVDGLKRSIPGAKGEAGEKESKSHEAGETLKVKAREHADVAAGRPEADDRNAPGGKSMQARQDRVALAQSKGEAGEKESKSHEAGETLKVKAQERADVAAGRPEADDRKSPGGSSMQARQDRVAMAQSKANATDRATTHPTVSQSMDARQNRMVEARGNHMPTSKRSLPQMARAA
jgi:hypothetical protein